MNSDFTRSSPSGGIPPRRERFAVGLAAGVFLLLLAAATGYDPAWSWFFAAYPGVPGVGWLFDSLLRGRPPGLVDGILAAYLAAGALYAAGLFGGAGEAVWRRRAGGYLLAVGWLTVVTVLALRVIFARPTPLAVFGGAHPFVPWFLPGGVPAGLGLAASSFPSLSTALLASCVAFAYVWLPAGRGGGRAALPAIALPLLALQSLLGVHQQVFWASDAAVGAAVGLGWAWWLDRRARHAGHSAAGAAPGQGGPPAARLLRLAGWSLAVALAPATLALGIRMALREGEGSGWGWALAGLGAVGLAILLKLGQTGWAAARGAGHKEG